MQRCLTRLRNRRVSRFNSWILFNIVSQIFTIGGKDNVTSVTLDPELGLFSSWAGRPMGEIAFQLIDFFSRFGCFERHL